ncbi:MAG: hypothetical protein MNPFHGCM_01598 [Gemmatimonadaceae bacterium]|nr:hypothetical protein [Gemmatimonadaceae bacterium]
MPLITLAYLAIAVGLLLGFDGDFVLGALCILGLIVAAVAGHSRAAFTAAGLTIGLFVSAWCSHADRECSREAIRTGRVRVRLDSPALPGARASATVVSGTCAVRAYARLQTGSSPAGSLVELTGEAKLTPRGLVLDGARLRMIEGPGVLDRLLAGTALALEELYGTRAPLAKALVVADERDVDRDVRERFADAGIAHMLSVSGLHVAILGEGVALLFGIVGLSRRRVHVATILTVAAYVALIGAPSPAIRSAVMLGAARIALLRQRPTSDWAALALGALFPLVDPREVTALGYQLSVAGMAALLASGRLMRRTGAASGGRLAALGRECGTTVIATAVSAPIVAFAFGRLSLIAPVTNLVVAPLFGLMQPALFLSLLLRPIRPLAALVADGAALLMDSVSGVATVAAAVPGSVWQVVPSQVVFAMLVLSAAALVAACASRYWARPALVSLAAAGAAAWAPFLPTVRGMVELHVLDVGQGDAVALRTPLGRWLVFDAGPAWDRSDAGAATVVPYIKRRGGDVALFTLSHPHADHAGGAAAVLSQLHTVRMWDAARVFGGDRYGAALDSARSHAVEWVRVHPGLTSVIDGVQLHVLAPDSAWTATREDPNTSSVVVRVTFGRVRFLLTGDAEQEEEEWLLSRDPSALSADVLKVAHHGSATSSTDVFLDAVRPRLALISVGVANRYGHPSPDVLDRFDDRGVPVMRTDRDGAVIVRTDGVRLWVATQTDGWRPVATP